MSSAALAQAAAFASARGVASARIASSGIHVETVISPTTEHCASTRGECEGTSSMAKQSTTPQ